MPISDYMRAIRAKVGHDVVLTPSVSGLVFDDAGRVLLARHATGDLWAAPGGAVDPDERPVDAVVRELWEETALHVEPVAFVGVFGGPEFRVRYENGDVTAYVISIFECRVLAGTPRPDGEEICELRWVAHDDLTALALSPWARTLLPQLVASRGRPLVPAATWRPPVA